MMSFSSLSILSDGPAPRMPSVPTMLGQIRMHPWASASHSHSPACMTDVSNGIVPWQLMITPAGLPGR